MPKVVFHRPRAGITLRRGENGWTAEFNGPVATPFDRSVHESIVLVHFRAQYPGLDVRVEEPQKPPGTPPNRRAGQ